MRKKKRNVRKMLKRKRRKKKRNWKKQWKNVKIICIKYNTNNKVSYLPLYDDKYREFNPNNPEEVLRFIEEIRREV